MLIEGDYIYKKAIIVNEATLRNLEQLLIEYFKNVSYCIESLDGDTIKFEDLEELLKYDNFSKRKIIELKILAANSNIRIVIRPSGGGFLNFEKTVNLSYTFKAIDDKVVFLSKINEIFEKSKAPYSFISKFSLYAFVTFLPILSAIFLFINGFINNDVKAVSELKFEINFLSVFIILPIMLLIYFLFDRRFWRYFFPPVVFLWGNEIENYKNKTDLRGKILWACIIAVIMGVISSVLASKLIT